MAKQPTPPISRAPLKVRLRERLRGFTIDMRNRIAAHRRRWLAIGLAALVGGVLGSVVLLEHARTAVVKPPAPPPRLVTLGMALAALDQGYLKQARELADQLAAQAPKAGERGGPDFIFGAITAMEAADLYGDEQRNYWLIAVRRLQAARKLGFPAGRSAQGLFLLGESLCLTEQTLEGRKLLEDSLAEGTVRAPQAHKLLAAAYHTGPSPDLAKAREHIELYLAQSKLLPAEREQGWLEQGRILRQLGESAAALVALEQIPAASSLFASAALERGQLILAEARLLKASLGAEATAEQQALVNQKCQQAIAVLRRAQEDPLDAELIRRSMYLIGAAFLESGDDRAALGQFERTRKVYLESAEGLSAALGEADLLRRAGRDADAVAAYRRLLAIVPESGQFAAPWLTRNDFQASVAEAYGHWLKAREFERAIAVAECAAPLCSQSTQAEFVAAAERDWGRNLLLAADAQAGARALTTRKQARTLLRKAGRAYRVLAKLDFSTPQYPEQVWQGVECFLEGHDFASALEALDQYAKNELRKRRPRALVLSAEALLALNRLDESLAACRECIDYFPRDAASFQARLLAARAHLERGETSAAEELLRQNLNGDFLTPESREWRDSLFELGKLLELDGRHEEAIERLDEAIARYPSTPQAIEARYLIAEACIKAAEVPQKKLEATTIRTARLLHYKQVQQLLAAAVGHYQQVQELLDRRQDSAELTPSQKAMLRNAYFAAGAALADLGRYDDAIRAYSIAVNRYQHDPEVLEAFVQIASCYRRLNKPLEARGTLEQAKVVLNRIKQDEDFTQATNYSRREWSQMLDWLSTL